MKYDQTMNIKFDLKNNFTETRAGYPVIQNHKRWSTSIGYLFILQHEPLKFSS